MTAKKSSAERKGPGRPEGRKFTQLLQLMVTPDMAKRMERHQHAYKFKRFTEAHRDLIERGLAK